MCYTQVTVAPTERTVKMITLLGVSSPDPRTNMEVINGCFVYASHGTRLVPLSRRSGKCVVDGVDRDMCIIVARADHRGRFSGYIANTTAKRLSRNDAMVRKSTGMTHVSWQVKIHGVVLSIDFSLTPACVKTLDDCPDIQSDSGLLPGNVMPKFLRDTGIIAQQPYAAFAASTYPDPLDVSLLSAARIEETLQFFVYCTRLARKLIPGNLADLCCLIDVTTMALSLAGLTQVKYVNDSRVDLPTMPLCVTPSSGMVGDCEDIAGYTVAFVCRCHHALQSIRVNAGPDLGDRFKWIIAHADCEGQTEAEFIYRALKLVWEFVPLHMVIRSGPVLHATVALATIPMTKMLFGERAIQAVPAHMRTVDDNGRAIIATYPTLSNAVSKVAPFVLIDATAFQPPTRLSDRFSGPSVWSDNDAVFDSTGNQEYCKSAQVVALLGAEQARVIDVLLTTLTQFEIPLQRDTDEPILTGRVSVDRIFDTYRHVMATYPPAPLYTSLDDGLTGEVDPSGSTELQSSDDRPAPPSTKIYKVGCKFLYVHAIRQNGPRPAGRKREDTPD